MTIDLDPYDDANGGVDVMTVTVSGNVLTADISVKDSLDSASWQTLYDVDLSQEFTVPATHR